MLRAFLLTLAAWAFAATAAAGPLSGLWTGNYVCAQGQTGLTLRIGDIAGERPGAIEATFSFYALATNPGVPSGDYSMRGWFDENTGRVQLIGVAWGVRPENYEMVNLFGALSANGREMSGDVEFPNWPEGCTTFYLTRDPALVS